VVTGETRLRRTAAVAAAALYLGAACALADVIRLTNGRSVEGLIAGERETEVVVDLGVGTMTIRRSRIESIERSDDAGARAIRDAWKKKYYLHRKHVPPGVADLARAYRDLEELRRRAAAARRQATQADARERRLRRERQALREQFVELSRRLEKADPKADLEAYNTLVVDRNAVGAGMTVLDADLKEGAARREAWSGRVSAYVDELSLFRSEFDLRREAAQEIPDPDETFFFDRLARNLEGLEAEFTRVAVRVESHRGGTVVTAKVNDRATGRFLLDTGAMLVTLNREFADRLKRPTEDRPSIDLVLADGSKATAVQILLDSVGVGEARVSDVPAAILPASAGPGLDGLLGMSFLRHFVVRLDGSSGRLFLSQFTPETGGD